MKVLPFKHLFDAQHVVPLSGEPLEIATTPDGLFLVATTAGIQVYNIPTSNTIDSEDNPNYGLIYSIPSVNKEITSLAYVPATDCIATLEKETDRSVISVARIYYNWRSDISKLAKHTEQTHSSVETTESSHEKSENRSLQVETIPSASSLICIAACPFTDKIAVATRSEISVWATTTTIKSDDNDHILCIPQKIFDVDLSVSASPVCKLSLINQFLCYSTLSDVHVVRVVTSLVSDSSDSAHKNQIDTKSTDNQTIVEDEFYFECNFEDGGMQQFQLSLPSLTSDQTGQNERRDQQKFSTDVPSAIRSEFRMQSQIRANKESGHQILYSNLVFYQTFERSTDNVNRVEQQVHTAILLPEFSLTDSRLDLTNFRAPTAQASLSSIPVSRLRCVISTQQKGYIYDIDISQQNVTYPELVTTYTYSAPTIAASCSNFLYTLSETGLEIYTLRCKEFGEFGDLEGLSSVLSPTTVNPSMNTYPGPCLVSIQSFIGLCRIEVVPFTDVLLLICKEPEKSRSRSASVSGQSTQPQQKAGGWNLYVLTSTSVHTLYEEIISQAEGYHESNPSVYYQLVLEMHLLLRSKLGQLHAQLKSSQRITTSSSSSPSLLNLLLESKNFHDLYRKSAGLLADFYFDHGDYRKSSRFYCLSWRPLSQVLNKMGQAPKNALSYILEYLDFVLFSPEQAEVLDEDNNLATKIVYYYQQSPTKLSNVVLHSNLKSYPKPLILEMLEKRKSVSTNKRENQAESQKMLVKDCLARAILYYQTSQFTKAVLEISDLNSEILIEYLRDHPSLIVANLSVSDTADQLILADAGVVIGASQPWTLLEALTNVSCFGSIHAEQKNLAGWHLLTQLKSKLLAFQPSFELCVLELCYLEWSLDQTLLKSDSSHITSKLVGLYMIEITSPKNQEKDEKSTQSIYERKWREYHENMLWGRPLWLNGLPPFNSEQIGTTFDLYMKKLQGILTHHNFQRQEGIKIVAQNILDQNFEDQSLLSLQLLSLALTGNLEQSFYLLLKAYSHVLLDFSKQFCAKIDDWRIVVCLLSQNENYKIQLQEILQYLATILQPINFMKVMPQNGDLFYFLHILENCVQLQEANLLRKQLTTSFLNVNVE